MFFLISLFYFSEHLEDTVDFSSDNIADINGGDDTEDEAMECEPNLEHNVEHSLSFIHAVINLKSLVNVKPTVSASHLKNIFHSYFSPSHTQKWTVKNRSQRSQDTIESESQVNTLSCDSGIYSGPSSQSQECISSDTLKYIMRSSETWTLLKQSVKLILNYLKDLFLGTQHVTLNFKSCVVEDAISTLSQILEDTASRENNMECHSLCIIFITEVTEEMLSNSEVSQVIIHLYI